MDEYTLIVHPTCPTSRELVLHAERRGLWDRIRLVVLDSPGRWSLPGLPWAVPALARPDGAIVAMDPLGPEELDAILEDRHPGPPEPVQGLVRSILYSAYASSIALSHHGIEPLLTPSFLVPAFRLALYTADPQREASRIAEKLRAEADRIYGENRELIARAMAVSVVRHLYYAGARSPEELQAAASPSAVAAIILGMASIGRSFLPTPPRTPDMADWISSFIRRRARGLLNKIVREERETLTPDYLEILRSRSNTV